MASQYLTKDEVFANLKQKTAIPLLAATAAYMPLYAFLVTGASGVFPDAATKRG